MTRHCSWTIARFQPRWSGHTAYRSLRGKDYTGEIVPFGEIVMYKVIENDGDKLNPRWLKGVYVGKIDQTDEFIFLTPKGAKKSRSIKRFEASEAWGREVMAGCVGAPWNPTGRPTTTVQSGTALAPGNKLRRMYISTKILDQFGRTEGCDACELHMG